MVLTYSNVDTIYLAKLERFQSLNIFNLILRKKILIAIRPIYQEILCKSNPQLGFSIAPIYHQFIL